MKLVKGILKMPKSWNSVGAKKTKKVTFGSGKTELAAEVARVKKEQMKMLGRGWELWCLKLEQCEIEELLFAPLKINGLLVKAMVDSGATISIVRMDQYNRMARKPPL